MGLEQWISSSSGALFLALGVLALWRGQRSPLAPPLALMCIAFFVYDAVEVMRHFRELAILDWIDGAAAALVAPPTLLLIAAFVGMRRRLAVALGIASSYFVGVALLCLSPLAFPSLAWFAGSDQWAIAMLAGMAPTFGAAPLLLLRHARLAGPEERARTQLFGLALLIGVGGVSWDLLVIAGMNAPRVGALGLVAGVILMGALALRARVIEGITGLVAANAIAAGALAIFAHLVVLAWFGDRLVLAILATLAITLVLLAVLRPLAVVLAEERARARQLAMLGRLSSQMAHDLRNPLAAIRGAAQFLEEERAQGRSIDAQGELVHLILEQADRLGRVVDDYQRLGKVEPVLAPVDLSALAAEVVSAQQAAARASGIELSISRSRQELPELSLDADLLRAALENLLRNACEAIASRGRGTIRVELARREREITLAVIDDGPGMDARTKERALDEFFTTKATGSGLGLAYVAKVARAHGGRVRVESAEGAGARVEMVLPIA